MKNLSIVLCFLFLTSCVQKLIEEPDNLISEEEITNLLYDLAVLNSAKSINAKIFKDHDIEPMEVIFSKYKVDSVQFVESNRYYASLPEKYESIYTAVNKRIKKESELADEAKKRADSIKKANKKIKLEAQRKRPRTDVKKTKDSL